METNRKPFSLEEWEKDKSQKVVTRDGHSVRIIFTDANIIIGDTVKPVIALIKKDDGCETLAIYTEEGYYFYNDDPCKHDLLFVTKPELSEFEKCMLEFADKRDEYEYDSTNVCELNNRVMELTHTYSKELLAIARKQLKAEGWEYTDPLFKEICDEQSDANGHLVGDMCVEYAKHAKVKDDKRRCEMDWKEFQQCAKHFYERGYKNGIRIGKYEAEKNIIDELKRILSVSKEGWLESNIKTFIKELEEK